MRSCLTRIARKQQINGTTSKNSERKPGTLPRLFAQNKIPKDRINMPGVTRGTGKRPRYIDPWLQPEALLMPTQTWELAKVMEMASGYFARFGDIHIFPTDMYKRCKFLRFLGYILWSEGSKRGRFCRILNDA